MKLWITKFKENFFSCLKTDESFCLFSETRIKFSIKDLHKIVSIFNDFCFFFFFFVTVQAQPKTKPQAVSHSLPHQQDQGENWKGKS